MKTSILTLAFLALLGVCDGRRFGRIRERLGQRSLAEMEFNDFISQYGRRIGTKQEYEYRLEIFTLKYNFINYHNSQDTSYKLALNKFADYSKEEWEAFLGSEFGRIDYSKIVETDGVMAANAPDEFSWVGTGALTNIKDQGASCSSSSIFTAVEALESAYYLKTGDLHVLSTQQVADCSGIGCRGGVVTKPYDYMVEYPLMDEKDYPMDSMSSQCRYEEGKGQAQATGYAFVEPNDPFVMIDNLLRQPLSVGIQASSVYFQTYNGGIMDDKKCGGENLDHIVQLVGYGYDEVLEKPYWQFRNSWGMYWGEQGYFRVLRDLEAGGIGVCGIQQRILYPTV